MTDCMCRGCYAGSGASLHYIPKDPETRQKWIDFIYRSRTAPTLKNLDRIRICSAHFTEECFTNYRQKMMGFGKRLILKPNAVPTIAAQVELTAPSRTRQEKVEETTTETRLCPLCQRSLKDCEALSVHLTKKHSVHPACLENLLISAPYAIRSREGVTESGLENINGLSQQKPSTKSHLTPVQQDVSPLERNTRDKSGLLNKGCGDGDTGTDQSSGAANGSARHPCPEFFTHRSALSVHYNIQNTRTEVRNEGDSASHILAYPYAPTKPYQCDLCHVSYFYPFGLENHLKSVLHQSRTRKAGITGALELSSAKPRNCAPQVEKVRIQPASSGAALLPNPAASAHAVPTVLPFLTLAPNSIQHAHVSSVYPAPGTPTTHLITQPQMLMPLIVNGLRTHAPTPHGPQQLVQQAVNVPSHLATTVVSSASQTPSETGQFAEAAGVKVKIEIKEEPCDREVSQTDPCTVDAISHGFKQENKSRCDGIENSRTSNATMCRVEGGDEHQSKGKGVRMGDIFKRYPPDANRVSKTEDPSNANLILTPSSNETCSDSGLGLRSPPVLTEFQSQVLWAFLESRKGAESVIPPKEDCEALGRVVGLTEDEVRKWLANTHLTKERHCAEASCERQESAEDDDDTLMIDESSGLILRSTTDFLSDEEDGDKRTNVSKKRKRTTDKEDTGEDS